MTGVLSRRDGIIHASSTSHRRVALPPACVCLGALARRGSQPASTPCGLSGSNGACDAWGERDTGFWRPPQWCVGRDADCNHSGFVWEDMRISPTVAHCCFVAPIPPPPAPHHLQSRCSTRLDRAPQHRLAGWGGPPLHAVWGVAMAPYNPTPLSMQRRSGSAPSPPAHRPVQPASPQCLPAAPRHAAAPAGLALPRADDRARRQRPSPPPPPPPPARGRSPPRSQVRHALSGLCLPAHNLGQTSPLGRAAPVAPCPLYVGLRLDARASLQALPVVVYAQPCRVGRPPLLHLHPLIVGAARMPASGARLLRRRAGGGNSTGEKMTRRSS